MLESMRKVSRDGKGLDTVCVNRQVTAEATGLCLLGASRKLWWAWLWVFLWEGKEAGVFIHPLHHWMRGAPGHRLPYIVCHPLGSWSWLILRDLKPAENMWVTSAHEVWVGPECQHCRTLILELQCPGFFEAANLGPYPLGKDSERKCQTTEEFTQLWGPLPST